MMTKTNGLYLAVPTIALLALFVFPIRAVGIISLMAATFVWWVFFIWYTLRSKWWKNPYGRAVSGLAFWLATVLSLFLAAILFGRYPGHEVLWTVAFMNLIVLGVQHIYHMNETQRAVQD